MALLADYTNLTNVGISASDLNTRFQAVWNALGYTSLGQGTLDWTNCSLTSAFRNTQVADTAVVCGTAVSGAGVQTLTKRTMFDSAALAFNTAVGNRETIPNVDGSTITTRTYFKRFTPLALLTINTLLPGAIVQVGDTICITVDNVGSAGAFTLVHTTLNTLNTFRMKSPGAAGLASKVVAAGGKGTVGTFVYGSLFGEANNQWWEL